MKSRLGMLAGVAATLLVNCGTGQASIVLFDNPNQSNACSANCQSFVDFGGQGFGAYPRVLTLQTAPLQAGSVFPDNSADNLGFSGDAISNGMNKGSTPSLADLGWTQGSLAAIGYNSNQTGNSGITLNQLTLTVYDGTTAKGSFSLASAINYTAADLALQQGNGNGLFIFVLDAAQRAAFNALGPMSTWTIGLFASLGCAADTTPSATCQPANDGPDSFRLISAGNPIINPLLPPGVPLPAAVWLFGSGLGALALLARRRKKERQHA